MKSIRFRLVRALKRIRNHAAQEVMETLSRGHIHSKSYVYAAFGSGGSVNDRLQERQIDYSVELPGLTNQVNKLNVGRVLGNNPKLLSELNRLSALALSHRSFSLLVDESGQAYDVTGQKWSRS